MRALALLGLLLASSCRSAAHDEAAILLVLREQRDAWNAGDIEEFMARGYWKSDELLFVSGESEHHGYQAVLERYRARYTEGGAEMGRLSFSELLVTEVDGDEATATGRWDLDFERSEDVGGHFTLDLRHLSEGWRIVRDETTSD
ncbi:MAG: nuclear transport factor 2 family protein [Planctomycetes bacterium]|nr:nuclear transport factor 2 family protein [Planctomycetota bacterium]